MTDTVRFRLNGRPATLEAAKDTTLLWALRTQTELTGTKFGCGEASCGACVVLVDGKPVRSCTTSAKSVGGKDVLTIEGLAQGERLHPLQQAFIDHGAFQCGYWTPGILLSAYALLQHQAAPTRAQIIEHLDGHLCRCGAHQRVVDAVEAAARKMGGRS